MTTADATVAKLADVVVQRYGAGVAATRLGTTPRTLQRWRRGDRKPKPEDVTRLRELAGLDTTAQGEPTSPAQGKPPAPTAADEGAPLDARATAEQDLRAARADLARARASGATATELGKLCGAVNAAARHHARVSGATELTSGQVLRSAVFRQATNAIVEAVRPWPDALMAVGTALRALEEGQRK